MGECQWSGEPMKTASVTLAGPLAALSYTTTWTAGTVLTICPSATFWSATGPSRSLVVSGTDLAGNPMAAYSAAYVSPPLEAFLHATAVPADMGGVAGADGICQAAATTAGQSGWAS